MASFIELTTKYNFWYAVLGFFEYHFDADWARRGMNRISKKKYGKDVFGWVSEN